ncbi:MAG: hypothetical protein M3332_03815, partial [Actinomycetota bacterium]|nr:hypothetical protein [Actinomycetota bacterium]
LARELLTERGFQLIPDSSAGPSSLHRHGIGYACHDTDLIAAGTRWFAARTRARGYPRAAGSRINPASPQTGGYPGTGALRPLRPTQPGLLPLPGALMH